MVKSLIVLVVVIFGLGVEVFFGPCTVYYLVSVYIIQRYTIIYTFVFMMEQIMWGRADACINIGFKSHSADFHYCFIFCKPKAM